ncbi:aldehyde dehydrogenase [Pseudovirgaria hyperparasitica]|uniref:Aldehyde dehydrogenase n=1 Tax=Pseudovirgaria hyperparasitica TaxID=470096 RepID=A0A6A6WD11_9PEZI|nr:aldehyde dehydrogenase [Pseudovirgaria hyperparasitica]KAF2760722.1 aldehyde dehydrogenase [Pseudovirgaria hyperparasitica]
MTVTTRGSGDGGASRTYSTPDEVTSKLATLRRTFASGRTKNLKYRKWQLKQLYWLIEDHEFDITKALAADLGKHEFETLAGDIAGCKSDILLHIANLEAWTADERPADAGFVFRHVGSAVVRKEPRGVVLVIGAWNFPLLLVVQPLVAAVAAGCTVLVKPSEMAARTEALLAELLPKYLDPEAYAVVTGGPAETGFVLAQRFDHIFFTGSAGVARHVALAAAKNLTPTVLELGGQGPAIVTAKADVDLAAKRILAAKFMNAGQICLSVNHVFVDPTVHTEFVRRLNFWVGEFNGQGDKHYEEMTNIINERNYDRLKGAYDKSAGKKLTNGREFVRENLRIPLTIVDDVTTDDSLMKEELFGPILPVIRATYHEAVREMARLPHALSLYIFSESRPEIDYILSHTLTGGVTINDCMVHAGTPGVPFGGVGDSGSGSYHGKYGVEAFTHKRAVVQLPNWLDKVMGFRYPPYDMEKNRKRVEKKNTLGFKRGEGIEDQVIKMPGEGGGWKKYTLVLALFAIAVGSWRSGIGPVWLQELAGRIVGTMSGVLASK